MTYIFVHIPKTAGTSFRKAAKQSLKCAWDYGLGSPETSSFIRETMYADDRQAVAQKLADEGIDLISGHFSADKYRDLIPDSKLIAFVRDPVSRLISEYNHHVRHGGYKAPIETFCSNVGHQNTQSKCFSGLDISDFYFVGVTEMYSESLQSFNRLSGLSLEELKTNRAVEKKRCEGELSREERHEIMKYAKSR